MVGQALTKALQTYNCEIITISKSELDLRHQSDVHNFMAEQRPNTVIMAAAKVGGIKANEQEPANFLYDNLMIQANVIHAAHLAKTEKLLFLGSSCIYPRNAPQPITEDALLTAPLEPTNEAYAIAKISGIKLCQSYRQQYGHDFISVMPCNLYGPYDYFNAERAHVIPALMLKIHNAKQCDLPSITLWGTGTPLREFLYVEDLADGLIHILQNYSGNAPLNIGSAQETSIRDLAILLCEIIGYDGNINFNPAMPDGTPRKIMDSSKINALGWHAQTEIKDGLKKTYSWFCAQEYLSHAA